MASCLSIQPIAYLRELQNKFTSTLKSIHRYVSYVVPCHHTFIHWQLDLVSQFTIYILQLWAVCFVQQCFTSLGYLFDFQHYALKPLYFLYRQTFYCQCLTRCWDSITRISDGKIYIIATYIQVCIWQQFGWYLYFKDIYWFLTHI